MYCLQHLIKIHKIHTWIKLHSPLKKNCLSMGANLASVHSSSEYHMIQMMTAPHGYQTTWVGGTNAPGVLFFIFTQYFSFCINDRRCYILSKKKMWIEDLGWRWVALIQGLWQGLTFWTNAVFNFRSIFGFGVMGGLSSTQTGAQESPLVVPVHFAYRLIIVVIQNMVA